MERTKDGLEVIVVCIAILSLTKAQGQPGASP